MRVPCVCVCVQAVKDRRQKTLAAKQSELQSDLRDQVAILQAAVNDRVRLYWVEASVFVFVLNCPCMSRVLAA